MNQGKHIFYFLVLFNSIVFCDTLLAADCEQTGYAEESYKLMLEEFVSTEMTGCFSAENNKTALWKMVDQQLKDVSLDTDVRVLNSLSSLQMYLNDEYLKQSNEQFDNAGVVELAIKNLKNNIQKNSKIPEKQLKDQWKLNELGSDFIPRALEGLDFTKTLSMDKCQKVGDGNCAAEFELAANLIRVIFLVNSSIDELTKIYRAEVFIDRSIRRKKWDSYYDDLTYQYPWELFANSYLLEKTDDRQSVDGNKQGFRKLPESKLVFFHPDANVVYAHNAVDEYEVSVTMEVLGFEAFTFDHEGKVKNPWGVSALIAYMDQVDALESGWTAGLLFKYNGYSLGVTDNHGELGIVLNINLAQKIFDVNKKRRRYYD